jgi:hypothetical protein
MLSSLTTPADKKNCEGSVIDKGGDPICKEEFVKAVNVLNITKDKLDFTSRETKLHDPEIDQKICLVSFSPAQGATPNEDGFYGMMKVRGSYKNIEDAEERSEYLIKNYDSYNPIFHAEVGKPFPITNLTKFAEKVRDHSLDEKTQAIYDQVKAQTKKENDDKKNTMQERQELMDKQIKIANSDDKDLSPEDLKSKYLEKYISYRLVYASNLERYVKFMTAAQELTANIIASGQNIKKLDDSSSYYRENYKNQLFETYKDAMTISPTFEKYFNINTEADFDNMLIEIDELKQVIERIEKEAILEPPPPVEEIEDEPLPKIEEIDEEVEDAIEKEVQGLADEDKPDTTASTVCGEEESKSDTTPAPVEGDETTPATPPATPAQVEGDESKGDEECHT